MFPNPGEFPTDVVKEASLKLPLLKEYIKQHSIDKTITQTSEIKAATGIDVMAVSAELQELIDQHKKLSDDRAPQEDLDEVEKKIADLEKERITKEIDKSKREAFKKDRLDYDKLTEADAEIQKLEAEIAEIEESPEATERTKAGPGKFAQYYDKEVLSAKQKEAN